MLPGRDGSPIRPAGCSSPAATSGMAEPPGPPSAVFDVRSDPPDPAALAAAAAALGAGLVVGLPTDTVYGLAVDARRPGAVDRVFVAKQRPRHVELPVLVADLGQALDLAGDLPAGTRALMEGFWPGALTLVVLRRPGLTLDLGERVDTIGLRCPDHPVARALCRAAGPLATTSANRHGEPPAQQAAPVAEMEGVALVLDAGRCAGQPSTVVDCTGDELRLLRQGALPWAAVQAVASGQGRGPSPA
jgi:L-threonylcarbamoyladenylate synthase